MPVVGRGRIIVWEGASLWILEAEHGSAETEPHRHHALQITYSIKGGFEIGLNGEWVSGPIVAVASDTEHVFRASGAAAHLFIDADSAVGRALSAELFGKSAIVRVETAVAKSSLEALINCFDQNSPEAELMALGRKIVDQWSAIVMPKAADGRVHRMIAFAGTHLDGKLSLPSAADHINLSPSRASHLFVENTGLAFKTYVLWLRLERAVELYASGKSLTEAAHEAGFADSAHFSRTFRRTFGLPAASLRLTASQA